MSNTLPASRPWRQNKINPAHLAYFVGWPDDLIVKVGSAADKVWPRYRIFTSRGATLHGLAFPVDCFTTDIEITVQKWLSQAGWSPAFDDRSEAAARLGNQGGGYTECYRAPSLEAYVAGVRHCANLVNYHDGSHWCPHPIARRWR